VGTDKRSRQKANKAKKLAEQQQEQRQARVRRLIFLAVAGTVAVVGITAILSFTGSDEEEEAQADISTESSTTTTEADLPAAVTAPEPGATIEGPADCPEADGSSERVTQFSETPPMCIDENATYIAEFDTTAGAITVELDASAAPTTVNNFVFLARYHYYDGTAFHRIVPGFVIQGGDAVGEPLGTGNPGYLIEEEPPEPGAYQVGSLAMAKASGPQQTGSQFFFVTGPQGEALPNEYSLFGTVTEGLDVVHTIEDTPTNRADYPTEEIYINSVTITEG